MPDLQGIRVVITRPRAQYETFANAIIKLGGKPICFPLIEVVPLEDYSELDKSLGNLDSYDWLIFTSVNGVKIVADRLLFLRLDYPPKKLKVAAVGSKTAQALIDVGIVPDFMPTEYISDAIISGLGSLKNKRILLPCAQISRDTLPQMIHKAGGEVDQLPVYRTIPVMPDKLDYEVVDGKVDAVTFTSSSAVKNFSRLINSKGMRRLKLSNPVFAYIGPITAQTARELNISVTVIANTYTTDGLVDVLSDYFFTQRIKL